MPDGMVRLALDQPSLPLVQTRAGDEEETIENVTVFIFADNNVPDNPDGPSDALYTKSNGFVQHSTDNIRYIDVYFQEKDYSVYVVCNHPKPEILLDEVNTLADLKQQTLKISTADGAHPGHYVMTGHATVASATKDKEIKVFSLASHLGFTITINTNETEGGDGGTFKLSDVYICNVPNGSYLLNGSEEPTEDELATGCACDYPYGTAGNDWTPLQIREKNYFTPIRLDIKEEGEDKFSASFDMFENRRGAVADKPESWPELKGLEGNEKYLFYKQLHKRTRAMDYPGYLGDAGITKALADDKTNEEMDTWESVQEGRFFNATYLRIDGIYQRKGGQTFKNSYYIYLGSDNYKDFNVQRSYLYNHEITIRAYHDYDHRVTGDPLNGLVVYATLDGLDAHCNVVKALMYSPNEWTVSVKNPDETPWLEVSHSSVYHPRLQGMPLDPDKDAAFSIEGAGGLNYFYVHTDEYIPDIDHPFQNMALKNKPRKGVIVCRSRSMVQEYEVEQYPAQILILERDYEPVSMTKNLRDTFFIERKLEQKYIPWGFYKYWCYKLDSLIAQGVWNGWENTRLLYGVALNGDKGPIDGKEFPPAYPDGLPYDHALGYVISKNRDRNGNGKIDPEEIMWYWPATMELQQIYETKDDNPAWLYFEGMEETFFSSTPSSSDKYGITVGYGGRVKMTDGKWMPVQRDRKYNVIACRRKNAWKGSNSGQGGGGVFTDPDWDEGDEVILPKGN